jgi:hypothetical protein
MLKSDLLVALPEYSQFLKPIDTHMRNVILSGNYRLVDFFTGEVYYSPEDDSRAAILPVLGKINLYDWRFNPTDKNIHVF